jgi:phytoene dehydrogenase-like protein
VTPSPPDAVVVGSGPNGLAAAIVLAEAGRHVRVYESGDAPGGGIRSAELTLPGIHHDVSAAVMPTAAGSPLFRTLPLAAYGLRWIEPSVQLAHPFDDGTAIAVERSAERTADELGRDRQSYLDVFGATAQQWTELGDDLLGPVRWPRHPMAYVRFGLRVAGSARTLARRWFVDERTRALVAGLAAHSLLPLDDLMTGAYALILGATAHSVGWVLPEGGAGRLAAALVSYLRSLGGEVIASHPVRSLDEFDAFGRIDTTASRAGQPLAPIVMCDLSPRPFLDVAGARLPSSFRRALEKYRYGPGVFKVDWALSAPIPWRAAECARAATVHLGGSFDEIAHSEADVWAGRVNERPFVLLTQPTLADPSRAPAGRHIAWAYCHVPNGSTVDALPLIERQIERFAPGFRDCVLARAVRTPATIARDNANLVGGDIGAGVSDVRQFIFRPTRLTYRTPVRGLYLCSAATPPGVGVHGMCGYFAATRALRDLGHA